MQRKQRRVQIISALILAFEHFLFTKSYTKNNFRKTRRTTQEECQVGKDTINSKMATTGMLGFAIAFCFVALVLVCLGFATDHWVDVTVAREKVKILAPDRAMTDPNTFSRYRGVFKVCYEGSETTFLDGHEDLVSGNCLWITGLTFDSDASTIDYEDEYDWRNHLLRTQLVSNLFHEK